MMMRAWLQAGLRHLALLCLVLGVAPAYAMGWFASEDSGRAQQSNVVSVADLPVEAQKTLALIKRGGPFPYSKDGSVFSNREGMLPSAPRGYYREYTVPTPGLNHRGARRIVVGNHNAYWYTADHYRSFKSIRE